VPQTGLRAHHTGGGERVLEHLVDDLENGARGAKREVQFNIRPMPFRSLGAGFQMGPHLLKTAGFCALETVNRLFDIPHGEDAPRGQSLAFGDLIARAETVKELAHQRPHHLPLFGIGVLRFVNQQMMDTAVQFEQDPSCRAISP
jgi:hypothetical protein